MFEGASAGSDFYGKWNMKIFMIALASSGLAFVFSALIYKRSRGKDKTVDKVKDFVNF